jgi:hypothetical protein
MRKIPNELRSQKRNASRSLPVIVFTVTDYDGAEMLVGLFTLNHLGKKFGKENIGLYIETTNWLS